MKAYLITSGEYSSYHVDYITLDKEKAKKFIMLDKGKTGCTNYEIEEYEIDDFSIETDNIKKYLFRWDIYINGEFKSISQYIQDGDYAKEKVLVPKETKNNIKIEKGLSHSHKFVIYVYLDEDDEVKATKIAEELLSKRLLEDLGL